MAFSCSLLDYLALRMGLTYLSDLRCAPVDAAQLGRILSAIQPQRFTEREWLDACEYITGRKAGSSVEAREFLFCFAAKEQLENAWSAMRSHTCHAKTI